MAPHRTPSGRRAGDAGPRAAAGAVEEPRSADPGVDPGRRRATARTAGTSFGAPSWRGCPHAGRALTREAAVDRSSASNKRVLLGVAAGNAIMPDAGRGHEVEDPD